MADCPCGSGLAYGACCGALHAGAAARDAEALMRSRYSAYVLQLEAYLLATWHPATRPPAVDFSAEPATRWLGLAVKRHERIDAERAIVEFVARYKLDGRAYRLHEISRFVRADGHWYYMDGELD